MGKIAVETCGIEGLKVITPTVLGDARGYFVETYNYNDYKAAGIDVEFVQDNQSASKKGVLRGLHFQIQYPQDKLVRVIRGEVFDVAVDLRKGSPTFGQWHGELLTEENMKQFYVPKGFASWCCRTTRNSVTNARNSTIPATRAVCGMTILKSGCSGRFRRGWN